ncbi:MAG: hypothetical protein EXQ97_03315 [Alphaproteobacteria bacterium]|nr:hypothetical protein [Alphaproteobacteria bacterium]
MPVRDLSTLVAWLLAEAGQGGSAFLGVDFSIGLPSKYARRAGIDNFMAWLPQAGRGRWENFFLPADRTDEIHLLRPFYPRGSNGGFERRQAQLVHALGVAAYRELHRTCD